MSGNVVVKIALNQDVSLRDADNDVYVLRAGKYHATDPQIAQLLLTKVASGVKFVTKPAEAEEAKKYPKLVLGDGNRLKVLESSPQLQAELATSPQETPPKEEATAPPGQRQTQEQAPNTQQVAPTAPSEEAKK